MKNLKLVVLIALVFNLVTVSCNSDDDNSNDPAVFNVMTIDGEDFIIETGFLTEFGDNGNESYDWDVTLLSEGFTIDLDAEESAGSGGMIYLDLNSDSASGLTPGVYTFSETREAFTWVFAEASPDFNAETEDGFFFDAVSGSVTISGTGNNQTILADLIDTNGNPIIASYTGALIDLN